LPEPALFHLAWDSYPEDGILVKMLIDWFVLRTPLHQVKSALDQFPCKLVEAITIAAMLSPIRGSANMVGLIRRPATYYHDRNTIMDYDDKIAFADLTG
jgi:hypothetical protein